jgi:5,5'-dehydrodivanillate O-demethylase
MTTRAENELLTRVGPGTPMGELLRRYWWPVGISEHLQDKPTFIRLLSEDLVLFRDGQGQPGVLAAQCSHRRANLCLGSTERRGLRCRYHGWLYDTSGRVLETPGEPADSTFKDDIRHGAYPAQELGGLVFTYLGPAPAPLLPRFDFLADEGERYAWIVGVPPCNWLQGVENGMDPVHVSFTHSDIWVDLSDEPNMGFHETEWGIVYKALRPGPRPGVVNYREHHLLLPGISVSGGAQRLLDNQSGETVTDVGWNASIDEQAPARPVATARWSVPIDDTNTLMIRLTFRPAENPGKFRKVPFTGYWNPIAVQPYKEYRETSTPTLGYEMPPLVPTEDATIVCSMGAIVDRENENLAPTGDVGMMLLRQVYRREIEAIQAGRDPKGTVRDEARNQSIPVPSREILVPEAEVARM